MSSVAGRLVVFVPLVWVGWWVGRLCPPICWLWLVAGWLVAPLGRLVCCWVCHWVAPFPSGIGVRGFAPCRASCGDCPHSWPRLSPATIAPITRSIAASVRGLCLVVASESTHGCSSLAIIQCTCPCSLPCRHACVCLGFWGSSSVCLL